MYVRVCVYVRTCVFLYVFVVIYYVNFIMYICKYYIQSLCPGINHYLLYGDSFIQLRNTEFSSKERQPISCSLASSASHVTVIFKENGVCVCVCVCVCVRVFAYMSVCQSLCVRMYMIDKNVCLHTVHSHNHY